MNYSTGKFKMKKIIRVLLLGSILMGSGCGTVLNSFNGGVSECQKRREPGQPRREINAGFFVIDLFVFFPGLAIDFATGGIYTPCEFNHDRIIKTDGAEIQCVVKTIDSANIHYIHPEDSPRQRMEFTISKKAVRYIYYFSGRTDTVTVIKPVVEKLAPRKLADSILKKVTSTDNPLIHIDINANDTIHSLAEALKAVVTIKITDGHGSGCIISPDGYVITNYHVVDHDTANELTLLTDKGELLKAVCIRCNKDYDLALLKISTPKKYTYLMATDSAHSAVIGESVYAIGTPLDLAFGQSLTKGIVSGNRKKDGKYFIQSDVSVNHGNSGGALINKKGTLLGIVNSKIIGEGVQGLGFAIPSYYIESALNIKFVK